MESNHRRVIMKINEKYTVKKRPIRILQFGEGNFLRCFVDWIISQMNDDEKLNFSSNIAVVQPIERGLVKEIAKQDGLYTVLLEGLVNNQEVVETKVIDCLGDFISPYTEYDRFLEYAKSTDLQFIISNTTEAGIVLDKTDTDLSKTPRTFPGKLLALLKTRYEYFNHDKSKGLDIIPCELIDTNGDELKKTLIALSKAIGLSEDFIKWLSEANRFYNTLVDRIVPGNPRNEAKALWEKFGYIDNFIVKGEVFHFWVIEDHYHLNQKFPADQILNVKFVKDITPYKVRKVKILNGSHTLMVPLAYLAGKETVRESMNDALIGSFVKGFIFEEVIPTIDLPRDDMHSFALSVLERYQNPFIVHELMSIALNSITKYKTRILPTIIDNFANHILSVNALYSLAALIVFYSGKRGTEEIKLVDDQEFLDLFKRLWSSYDGSRKSSDDIVTEVLSLEHHWGIDLSKNREVNQFVKEATYQILTKGIINDFLLNNCRFAK